MKTFLKYFSFIILYNLIILLKQLYNNRTIKLYGNLYQNIVLLNLPYRIYYSFSILIVNLLYKIRNIRTFNCNKSSIDFSLSCSYYVLIHFFFRIMKIFHIAMKIVEKFHYSLTLFFFVYDESSYQEFKRSFLFRRKNILSDELMISTILINNNEQ